MNTLSYGLLSLLNRNSRTGYELMQHIQPFWQAKHSQIYPLLAQLEQKGHVQFVHVPQSDKPDKKVYSLTELGREALRQWILKPTDEPVTRDELMLKVYCIGLVDRDQARKVIEDREVFYRQRLLKFEKSYEQLQQNCEKRLDELGLQDPQFSHYVLLHKALARVKGDLAWCDWVKAKL
ncbi:PadR family transcriptional regulator [Paenibacillus sedimenti]|uniref:PadR family transcriptional regulator n=1 Tax=Paenibacillus sedimenti TaxID=2770274 RepID=A0A926KQJ9_9BACL|nr:PadR family transcriptional regulator [Paenibacillus sedimenti]MBD0382110.1 PadR family transcriptional regulator [Paenibacillus sedimenti]